MADEAVERALAPDDTPLGGHDRDVMDTEMTSCLNVPNWSPDTAAT